jgi:hypothetical protein
MNTQPIRIRGGWLAGLVALVTLVPCHAQTLVDSAPAEPGTPGAQIVVVGPSRKFAIVDGHPVQTGDHYNGAKLVDIDKDSLVWQRGTGSERSSMHPAVVKTAPGGRDAQPSHPAIRKKILNGEVK